MYTYLSTQEFHPIPKEITAKNCRKPDFLSRVRTNYVVESHHSQIKEDYEDGVYIHKENLQHAQQHFHVNEKNLPKALKLVSRAENPYHDEVYYVIGTKTICEGEIHREYSDYAYNVFTQRRSHKIAVLTNKLNEQHHALLADLIYEEDSNDKHL